MGTVHGNDPLPKAPEAALEAMVFTTASPLRSSILTLGPISTVDFQRMVYFEPTCQFSPPLGASTVIGPSALMLNVPSLTSAQELLVVLTMLIL